MIAARPTLVLVGMLEGAFGVHGEARVRSFTAPPENLFAYGPLRDADGRVVLTPKAWRAVGEGFAVSAPEIASREQALELRNTPLHAPRALFAPPDADEFYVVDLIGCAVEDVTGAPLGDVIAVHDFGAGDIVEIRQSDGRMMQLTFTRETFPEVDLSARRLVADPPPGSDDEAAQ